MTSSLQLLVFSQLIQRNLHTQYNCFIYWLLKEDLLCDTDAGRSAISNSIWPDSNSLWGRVCWQALPFLWTVDDEMRQPRVTEWSSSWWPHWGRRPRAPGRPEYLSVSKRTRPGGEVVDKTGAVSSARQHSPGVCLSIRQNTIRVRRRCKICAAKTQHEQSNSGKIEQLI